jgi:hypothetical protein
MIWQSKYNDELKKEIFIGFTSYLYEKIYAQMFKSKHSWWMYNNYIKKLIIERLSQIKYDFFNIWKTMIYC